MSSLPNTDQHPDSELRETRNLSEVPQYESLDDVGMGSVDTDMAYPLMGLDLWQDIGEGTLVGNNGMIQGDGSTSFDMPSKYSGTFDGAMLKNQPANECFHPDFMTSDISSIICFPFGFRRALVLKNIQMMTLA
ncbi:putative anthocyanin regulatory C1 protein-like [Cocos nucifera]|uniref:Putative anthocyanin regulatory C1 protein-like n=1 Tax=Cocos nucifera TaxID=13894 RepID=A0A8K0ISW0_COCNU|nr:putative anthocyanin regulatory C1 protein-like [Cocos nucifera]